MTEHAHEGRDVVDVLRAHFGPRYQASIDGGRDEIARVLADQLNVDGGEADALTSELIDSGRIRYVTAVERDPDYDREAQHDERSDAGNHDGGLGIMTPDLTDGSDSRRANAISGQGGPSATAAGMHGGMVAPVAAAGTGNPLPGTLPLAASENSLGGADDRVGYWEFGGGSGVVPSTTRKGQVEPSGT